MLHTSFHAEASGGVGLTQHELSAGGVRCKLIVQKKSEVAEGRGGAALLIGALCK